MCVGGVRRGPALVHQLLAHPEVDPAPATPSYAEFAVGHGLTAESMAWFWRQYLRDDADAHNPYAAPLRAADLSGLPPALILTAEYDPVRDEAEAYAERLREAGVQAASIRYAGAIHGFFDTGHPLDQTQQALTHAAAALKAAFAG